MIQNEARFNELVNAALAQDFSGWDFSYIHQRWQEASPSWDYAAIIKQYMRGIDSMLNMGTGGGEFLSSLAPLPKNTHATEGWEPNIPVAKKQLEAFDVTVHPVRDYVPLPLEDNQFDLVINRHEWYDPAEVYRILKPKGIFITQQVGEQNDLRLNELISEQAPDYKEEWHLASARKELRDAQFEILQAEEAFPPLDFFDIGAVVYYLKVVIWQIPDFSVEKYHEKLAAIHNMIEEEGKLSVTQHRFLLVAHKSEV